jgi:hypothetical protein
MTPAVTNEKTHLVRERHFSLDSGDDSILAALAHLRREHVTGTLMVDIACGGAASLRFREEQKVTFDDASAK